MTQTGQGNQNQAGFPLASPSDLVTHWGLVSSFYDRNRGQPSKMRRHKASKEGKEGGSKRQAGEK